ncbi:tripartite tricarboxylate transporter TctB family protein [Yoonia maritima]|uniref:Tripartite tricarboxylate transporter TctB family protein n=1 Tax=Yoonia maritima TaxID=1435347 RepID=A0A2T0VXN7_9RHOB|nr:tripartite tricarboxylate transporter TctB family protein [Yoonia maritima]PRY76620.1 tripartite tricarboxylate transporter TctB family protein [Yoonia maritima]
MNDLTKVSIDFEQSHLVFPRLIAVVLAILLIAIIIRDHKRILNALPYWKGVFQNMDKMRFLGALGVTLLYFSLMVPVGNIWPNTGSGFLICSIPFVLIIGLLFMHERPMRSVISLSIVSVVGPVSVWWLFTYPFFLTLP